MIGRQPHFAFGSEKCKTMCCRDVDCEAVVCILADRGNRLWHRRRIGLVDDGCRQPPVLFVVAVCDFPDSPLYLVEQSGYAFLQTVGLVRSFQCFHRDDDNTVALFISDFGHDVVDIRFLDGRVYVIAFPRCAYKIGVSLVCLLAEIGIVFSGILFERLISILRSLSRGCYHRDGYGCEK